MSDYPMLISNKLHSFRNFLTQSYDFSEKPRNKNATFVVWVDWSCRKKDENLINSNCLNKRFLYDVVCIIFM